MDIHQKAASLNAAGRMLGEVYGVSAPPLLIEADEDRYAFGAYGDGYSFSADRGAVEGADYGIRMNTLAEVESKKLFGDDPLVALETYAHEFRHSYQAEQLTRFRKPQFRGLVDDLTAVESWDHEYVPPEQDFDAYQAQPVEKDARNFAQALVHRVYGRSYS